MSGLTGIVPPPVEPVTLAEMHVQLKLDLTSDSPPAHEDDAYIAALIVTARAHIEAALERALVTQTWDLALDGFPCGGGAIGLRRPPVQSVDSITYLDTAGAAQTLDPAVYRLVRGGDWHPRVELLPGRSWPSTYGVSESVTVRAVHGYPPSADSPPDLAANVPAAIRHAIKLYATHLYRNREPVNIGNIVTEIPKTIDALLEPLRKRS